ncbi:hypothetical protein VKT23_009904 [Stygiomarasmius scandens]|uniref:Uncharacterized protein n=1 Tax=Marasmiellus scandens TaxID=2682957 RepID=A0ABR1JJJ7_9AGAR
MVLHYCSEYLKVVLPIQAAEYFALSLVERDQKLAGWRHSTTQRYESSVVFVDEEGVSLVWYLPDLFSGEVKSRIQQKTTLIQKKLVYFGGDTSTEHVEVDSTPAKKRRKISEHQFVDRKWKPTIFPGVCSFSFTCKGENPAGEVSITPNMCFEEPAGMQAQTEEWLARISEHQILVSLVLSFIHPGLYQAGRRTLEKCCQETSQRTAHWAKRWNSVFTSLTVISGRTSAPHVEPEGASNYFDSLVALGSSSNSILGLRELNVSFRSKSGTGVFFSGQGWTHKVPDWGTGESLSYVSHMHPELIEYGGGNVEQYGLKLPLK